MSHSPDDPIKNKWQRAEKIARGKAQATEAPEPGAHHQHAEHGMRRRSVLSLADTVKQIDSFFDLP
ncbi:MAG: hypothetical protein CFE49_07465 [Pseudomonas sp. PGPPP3]|jgi:hypothetical protein|nr:MAG: hypothetical protein CFE49_07465 [Pseudomonas sp. PGPPP3]